MIIDYHTIQNTIDQLLYEDETLNGLVKGVYINRGVPDGAPFPYVTKGATYSNPKDTKTTHGASTVYQLDVWGQRDDWEIHEIMSAVQAVMDRYKAESDKTKVFHSHLMYSGVQLDPDGKTRHGILQYRIFTIQK